MTSDFQSKIFIPLPRAKCCKVRSAILERLRGSLEDHYALLDPYLAELRKVNPRNIFSIICDREFTGAPPVFKRLYIGFKLLKRGFLDGCRPIIAVDGCFLKTFLGGQLLSTICTNGNNQMFSIAWAVVEGENFNSWRWFLGTLCGDLEIGEGYGWTFISDQQKVLSRERSIALQGFGVYVGEETNNTYFKMPRSRLVICSSSTGQWSGVVSPQQRSDHQEVIPTDFQASQD
ncbi:hypothetical protein Cni_G13875 [Canna indica]|uniref:MULE transposase domain-containing protein n=1 Tax=Canna indica TaxID=4628 RepID=A0AAQ3KBZ2_9LILI|nr:hypothetical protein Cni_G13875 [Canna indica]